MRHRKLDHPLDTASGDKDRSKPPKGLDSRSIQRTVRRHEFPITAAYAFTDYLSQGQTVPAVLVDIATLPMGGLTCSTCMSHSGSSGRAKIYLLCDFDFDDKIF